MAAAGHAAACNLHGAVDDAAAFAAASAFMPDGTAAMAVDTSTLAG